MITHYTNTTMTEAISLDDSNAIVASLVKGNVWFNPSRSKANIPLNTQSYEVVNDPENSNNLTLLRHKNTTGETVTEVIFTDTYKEVIGAANMILFFDAMVKKQVA